MFVKRDFVTFYKQTILGPLWYIIQPLVNTIVFTIIFGNLAKLPTDGLPAFLFYMTGNVAWSYFSVCLMATSNTFVSNAGLFGKLSSAISYIFTSSLCNREHSMVVLYLQYQNQKYLQYQNQIH